MVPQARYWAGHPHGPTLLTTVCLAIAAGTDLTLYGRNPEDIDFVPDIRDAPAELGFAIRYRPESLPGSATGRIPDHK